MERKERGNAAERAGGKEVGREEREPEEESRVVRAMERVVERAMGTRGSVGDA